MKLRRLKRWHGTMVRLRRRATVASDSVLPFSEPREEVLDSLAAFFVAQFAVRNGIKAPK